MEEREEVLPRSKQALDLDDNNLDYTIQLERNFSECACRISSLIRCFGRGLGLPSGTSFGRH